MQRDEVRKIVTEQFYNSLTASGVQITAIPSGQLHAFVEAMADGLFAALAAVEQEGDLPIAAAAPVAAAAAPPVASRPPTPDEPGMIDPGGDNAEEVRLWTGRPYLSIGIRYELTSQRLRIYRGVLGNRIEEIELIRVKDSKVKQHMGERMLNIGDVTIISADPMTPEIVLQNVHDPVDVREIFRKAVLDEKARRGLYYREDIGDENR
jgi:hypothetical protein